MNIIVLAYDWILMQSVQTNILAGCLMIGISILYTYVLYSTLKYTKEIQQVRRYKDEVGPLIENSRALEHEFRNQLATLNRYIHEDNEDAVEHIDQLRKEIEETNKYQKWNNPVIGAIIQEKYEEAQKRGIVFNAIPIETKNKDTFIANYHMVSLIGNLIDNAFDAVEPLEKKVVQLVVESTDQLKISICNYYDGDNTNNNKWFQRGFSQKGNHRGYGLYIVKRIVSKYNGDIEITYHKNKVIIDILFTE